MVSQILKSLARSSSRYCHSHFLTKSYNNAGLTRFSPGLATRRLFTVNRSEWRRTARNFNSEKEFGGERKGGSSDWRILQRFEVPWGWQTFSLTSIACVLSFSLTGRAVKPLLGFLGIEVEKLSLDQKAGLLLLRKSLASGSVLAVIFTVAKSYVPLPRDILRFDLKQPFNLRKGWLLWGGIGLAGSFAATVLTRVALSSFKTEPTVEESRAKKELRPLIGHSYISTLSVVGASGILPPLVEETLFRGFIMASLTKWVPTPVAIIISSAAFALVHRTPSQFPQLFVSGLVFGLSYAQTRNLMTPMIIHGFWNTGMILLLTYRKLKGTISDKQVDIKEL